jgi:methylaspartate mutase sigma subunit
MVKAKKVLLGSVGSDVHSVANRLIDKHLSDTNFQVCNLGVSVPINEWLEKYADFLPDLVLIGTMNGDLEPVIELVRNLREISSDAVSILIGGNPKLGSTGISLAPIMRSKNVWVLEAPNPSFLEIQSLCESIISSNTSGILNSRIG